ncbi:hypothetical protein OsI_12340 [Oryza sativa Indica Group]|uniref:K+ potassium transporter C-terminal domain-containing protein n=1 Tax=Oryza sativa subsp. indica TaxID=39946 RepID=B8AL47_ORYSI|nr:hypothetical protein OsI_12340 [Oryza sativa Indica Group]
MSVVLMVVMIVWHYVHVKRYKYELEHTVSTDKVKEMLESHDLKRVRGVALFYTELVQGIPPIFPHLIEKIPTIHSVLVFISIKHLPVPHVDTSERFLFRQVELKDYKVFRCVARYGYRDSLEEAKDFVVTLLENLQDYIRDVNLYTDEPHTISAHSSCNHSFSWEKPSGQYAVHAEDMLTPIESFSEITALSNYGSDRLPHFKGQQETSSSLDTTRTCCKARVQFSVCRKEIWMVQKVVLEHNHDLVSPNKSHKLRSQRRVIEADRQLIGQIREAGMKPAQVYGFMKEWYGGADKVPFSKMDCNNEIGRERKKWTKYAKSGFYIQKQGSEKETLKAHAARISRHATSVVLKCSVSKELLDDLEQAINKLDLEADNSLSNMQEKSCEVPLNSNGCVKDTLNGTISFLVPRVVKGPKSRQSKDVVEKKKWQKKSSKKKFEDPNNASENRDEDAGDVYGQSSTMDANDMYGQSSTMVANDVYGESSTMPTPLIQGGYTNLLFEVQQDCTLSSSARKLHFP